jgi:hypothetical protein
MIARDLNGERLALIRADLLERLAWLRLADDPFNLYPLRDESDWPLDRLTAQVRELESTRAD